MLTAKQYDLLLYVHQTIQQTGVSPSFDEMREALALKSKSGIHRLISALEERGFLRRLPHKARALEILKLPENMMGSEVQSSSAQPGEARTRRGGFSPKVIEGGAARQPKALMGHSANPGGTGLEAENPRDIVDMPAAGQLASLACEPGMMEIPVLGRIAAGSPVAAIELEQDRIQLPASLLRSGAHFALEIDGLSMIDAGIHDGDLAIIQRASQAEDGEIVVALVDEEEATLKTFRRKGKFIALEAANPDFETQRYSADRVRIQGRLVSLVRRY